MKKIFVVTVISFYSMSVFSQDIQKEKNDAIKTKVVKFFNEQNSDSLYSLAGVAFKKQLSAEKFKTICDNNLFPLGEIKSTEFEKIENGVSKYKATFDAIILSMYLSLDSAGMFEAFLFQPYKKEVTGEFKKTTTDNNLSTALGLKVDSILQKFMFESKTVGLSIGILKDGQTYFYNYGETKKGNGQTPTAKNLYEIGSITKTFTGILLAQAVTEKRVKLNDPVNKYLPADIPFLKVGNDTIRLVHLSNHTSGLPRMPDNIDLSNIANPYKDYSVTQLFNYLKTVKLTQKPGTKIEYSNLGVGLLGIILERLKMNRISFGNMVKKYICDKAEMADTKQFINKKNDAVLVQGYNENIIEQGSWDFLALAAAGALCSNASDMLKYAAINISAKDKNLQKAIELAHQITFDNDGEKIGLNWFIKNWGWGNVLFHNGGTGGYRSFLTINPATKNAVVILSNTAVSNDDIGVEILKYLDK